MIKIIWIILISIVILLSVNLFYALRQKRGCNNRFVLWAMAMLALLSFPFTQAFIPYYAFELGGDGLKAEALAGLNAIRKQTKKRWPVVSGYRAPTHNQKVGGASNSQHVYGVAFDVRVPHKKREKFYKAAKQAGFTAFGWGNVTVHIDMGPKRWWTYDNKGKAASGQRKYQYLHKAPESFKQDYGL